MLGATNLIPGPNSALIDVTTGLVTATSALLLIYYRANSAWLIFAAGLVGSATTRWSGG
jgi:chromate transport protein ChrA